MSLDVHLEINQPTEVFWANITHNLCEMASEAGIYKALWRPEEIRASEAGQLIEPLKRGIEKMKSDPERFKLLNPENGWGSYEGLLNFTEEYLEACERYPNAKVRTCR